MFTFVTDLKKHKIRVVKSIALYSCAFVWGLSFAIVGPTLIDLAVQTGTDLTMTSLIIPIRAGGYMAGSLASSVIYDRVNVLINCIGTLSLAAIMNILVPLLRNIWAILSLFVVMGFAFGLMEASVNIFILHLWGKEVTPFLQGLTFFFGLGALLSPLFTKPFILPIETSSGATNCDGAIIDNRTIDLVTTTLSYVDSTTQAGLSMDDFTPADLRLIYPYAFNAIIAVVAIIFFLLLYIYSPTTEPHPSRLEPTAVEDEPSSDLTMISRGCSFSGSTTSIRGHRNVTRNLSDRSTVDRRLSPRRSNHLDGASYVNQSYVSDSESRISSRTSSLTRPTGSVAGEKNAERGQANKQCSSSYSVRTARKWYRVEDPIKLTIIGLSAAFILVYFGLVLTFGSFLAPFAVSSNVHMDTREGAQLASIFWAAFTFWRLFTILYISFTGPKWAIIMNIGIIAVGAVIIVPWGFDERWALYTGTILIGLGVSPIWGTMLGFVESQFPVSPAIASCLMISCAVGELIFPVFLAYYMECEPIFFNYFIALCSVLVACFFTAILLVCNFRNRQRSTVAAESQ